MRVYCAQYFLVCLIPPFFIASKMYHFLLLENACLHVTIRGVQTKDKKQLSYISLYIYININKNIVSRGIISINCLFLPSFSIQYLNGLVLDLALWYRSDILFGMCLMVDIIRHYLRLMFYKNNSYSQMRDFSLL